jgi:8-oxo-dGTP diphosphatase
MENKKIGAGFGVMMIKDDKILLGQRHSDSAKASSELHGEGTWTMPGGKLDFGEMLEDGAYREVLEETGIEINKDTLQVISLTNNIVPTAHFLTVGFLCSDWKGEAKVMEPNEITRWSWFPLSDLPLPLFFPSQQIITNYVAGRFYTR